MRNYIFLFFLFIFSYNQCESIPRFFEGKDYSNKDISAYANGMLKSFTPKDGLPQSSIMSIAVDSSGFLWVGTQDGAAYYDGQKWTTVNLPNRTVSNYVETIFVASDSAVWLSASRGQLHRYFAGHWQSFNVSDGPASTTINTINETIDKNGQKVYWFGTIKGLSRYSGGKWVSFNTKNSDLPSNVIYDICPLNDGSLLIATRNGVLKYHNGIFQNVKLPNKFLKTGINKIIKGKNGDLWFAKTGTIAHYKNKKWTIFHTDSTMKKSRIRAMYESRNGDLWIGSSNGIMRIKHTADNKSAGKLENFLVGTDFEKRMGNLFCIQETQGGEIWFGSLLGLFRYMPSRWKTLNQETGLSNTLITYIYETSSGVFLFGTPRGLFQYFNGVWKIFDNKTGLSNNFIKAILEAKDRTLWVGTLGGGVNHYVNGRWHVYKKNNGLADNRVYSILQSNDGALWFATARGASRYYKGKWKTITTADGLIGNQIMSLYQSQDGSIWFGTRSGLSRLYNGRFLNYNTSNGLCGNVVQCINGTSDGSLWFGTSSGGVSRFNRENKTWKTYNDTSTPRLTNNVILQVEEDRFGRLYIFTNKGITRFSPGEWLPASKQINFAASPKVPAVETFTEEDGLPGSEGLVRAMMLDLKGRIWIGTTAGAAYFDPDKEIVNNIPKKIVIEKITIQNLPKNKPLQNGMELSYKNNNIMFEYSLLSFFKESKTLYQTQLYPYETSPNSWSSNYRKEYTNLSNGSYVFRVWAKDYSGNLSGPKEFSFKILPPFWKEWWFVILLFLLVLGAIYLTIKIITARKLKRQVLLLERQKLIEHERGRISKDMHDTVGSSLTRIAMLSDRIGRQKKDKNPTKEKQEATQNWTELIGTTAREVIATMNEIIWSLSPKQDNLESLINYTRHFINSMFETTDIQYSLDIPEFETDIILTPDFRRNIFLIIKETINNIVKHSYASNVSLSISVSDGNLNFVAIDDGVGIIESSSKDDITGFGLKNMKERAASIGAKFEIESNSNSGTTTRLCAPLQIFHPI